MRITEFDWDEDNVLHLALGHGIEAEEVEEVMALTPVIRRTKRGHYAAFGPTRAGRLLVVIFEQRGRGRVRPITGWDMDAAERRYYMRQRRG